MEQIAPPSKAVLLVVLLVLMLPIALGNLFGGTLLTHLYTQDTKQMKLARLSSSLLGTVYSRNGRSMSCFGKAWEMETPFLCTHDWHVGLLNWDWLSA